MPLLIFPRLIGNEVFNQTTQASGKDYYVSTPWEIDTARVEEALRYAEDWLANVLGQRITWNPVRVIDSQRTLTEWRLMQINLMREEVEKLGLDWNEDSIYLAFVRGMGGYAGGISYQDGGTGHAMVGDICLEAICENQLPTAGSVLLGGQGWPTNSYGLDGQRGAFIHEVLHGLDLPHPDGWPANDQPGVNETLMGNWWNMPGFDNTAGLTQREVDRVLRWMA